MRVGVLTLFLSLLVVAGTTAGSAQTDGSGSQSNQEPAAAQASGQDEQQPEKTELDLPVNDAIKVTIEPLQASNLVDRVVEPCRITIKCADAVAAQVFVVPVDAPYGGHAIGKPVLIGTDKKPADGLSVHWDSKAGNQYVKLFAVVRLKNTAPSPVRSRTLDLGVGRFNPTASE